MGLLQVMTQELSLVIPLKWKEETRHGPKEFSGLKPDAQLDPELFFDRNGSPRIPEGIDEAFSYSLQIRNMQLRFSQQYYNSTPLTLQQCFGITFGDTKNTQGEYDNNIAFADGFEMFRIGVLYFTFAKYGDTKRRYIDFESQNLGLFSNSEGWTRRNRFTSIGIRFMTDLIGAMPTLIKIPGMQDEDATLFRGCLEFIAEQYNSGKIEPRPVMHT